MNSVESEGPVSNSPPIKDENYAKTAALLKVINQDPDINSNELGTRSTYIPYEDTLRSSSQQPVELQVTNLDQNIEQREMRRNITTIFRDHVPVLHVSVFFQSDGNMAACVRVPSPQDAQYAISQLHRRKIGFKRILISRNDGQGQNPVLLRSKVIDLLSEVPGGKLQLFKFREMYEKRYHDSIGVSELYKMKDVVGITEEETGRMVQLHLYQASSSAMSRAPSKFLDSATCPIHCQEPNGQVKGWAEKESGAPLPNVIIGLTTLGPNIKNLIKDHGGSMPLATLRHCYEAEFPKLDINDDGVPLEHLASAIQGVTIQLAMSSGVKVLSLDDNRVVENDEMSLVGHLRSNLSRYSGSTTSINTISSSSQPPPAASLAGQLALFSRELVDLLKTSPGCRMPFHKFIPMYHHYFGRQCRVADYGYTKLKDLFEALPHVVQIIGEGSRAMITLSHRAQVKRFTSDLLKVLKSQPSKQIALYDLPSVFEKMTHRVFKICDYGVCEIEDMISDVSETSVVITTENNDGADDVMISIPKREQTNEEVSRTHKFAGECIELLRHVPECRLPFNKFIPAYHHHFGRQCRVADYGFTKLIELFEAIPTTIEITEDADGDRILQLTDVERLHVLGDQVAFLTRHHCSAYSQSKTRGVIQQTIKLSQLPNLYLRQYGYALRPENYGESSLSKVIEKLNSTLRLDREQSEDEPMIRLIDKSYIKILSNRVKEIISDNLDGKMTLDDFKERFKDIYDEDIDADQLKRDFGDLIVIQDETIELVPLQLCGIRIQNLLKDHGDKILMSEFEAAFAEKYMTPLCPGHPGLANLLAAFPDTFVIRGRGPKKIVCYLREGRKTAASRQVEASLASRNAFLSSSAYHGYGRPSTSRPSTTRHHSDMRSQGSFNNYKSIGNMNSWMPRAPVSSNSAAAPGPPRSRPIPQASKFNHPPPTYGNGLAGNSNLAGFGGSSGPGCGGGEFWAELAQFGIGMSHFSNTNPSATRSYNFTQSTGGRYSTSPAFVSPIPSPNFYNGGSATTSMLPTPHSPSPLLQNRMGSTHFAFPPTRF